ncbi:hypothetical protein [Ensifer adhaerens]|uniref:hypothetical protein n=1 Tax=Ensifer adhaerens TaxID=106592 RepID=UPI000CF02CD7|nr:hypothetical protein [Ensifer adhaerens]
MTDAEIRLRCLELAMEQAKREGLHSDRNAIADIATQFYNRIVIDPATPPEPEKAQGKRGRTAADKSPEIFK